MPIASEAVYGSFDVRCGFLLAPVKQGQHPFIERSFPHASTH